MKLTFWGTRGSLPATFTGTHLNARLRECLEYALNPETSIKPGQSIEDYLQTLPAHITRTYGVNTSCISIESSIPDEYLLCDAGSGIRDFGVHYASQGKLKRPACFHIFLTHLHWDHIQGLPFFAPIYVPGNKIVIHGHHPDIEEYIYQQMNPPCFPVPLKAAGSEVIFDIKLPWETFDVCGFHIQSIQQNHPGISFGYRFERDNKTIVYSTDCEHTETAHEDGYPFLEFFKNADVLIFDAMYSLAMASILKSNWGHSNNFMGIKLAAKARVKHLLLFHHEPTSDDQTLEKFLKNTQIYAQFFHRERKSKASDRYPLNISLATDGMVLDL